MTDTDKLKRLKKEIKRKEFWRETRDCRDYVIDEICDADDYGAEERYVYSDWLRDAILALIAERDEAVALLREIIRTGVEETCEHGDQREAMRRISLLIASIDAANNTVA